MNVPHLLRMKPLPPSDLLLSYSDGSSRKFSCAPYLDRGVFTRLKDPAMFCQAYVAHGTVCWPGALDIAPETLFLKSEPVAASEPLSN